MTANCRWVSTTEPRVIPGRHGADCAGEECRGCLPCAETHCVVCGREHAKAACVGCLEAARSDLQAIGDLCSALPAEAVEKGVQSEAMMLLSPSADPEAWRNRATSAMVGRLDAAYLEDCRDEMHPAWVLFTWEQIWRDHLDHRTEELFTLATGWSYLNTQIGYMSEQIEPPFDEFARELRACKAHLENVLRAGIREEKTRVPCLDCDTRLIKVYSPQVIDDHWRCPKRTCNRTYNAEEFARAKHFHLASEWADKYVLVSEALSAIPRPEQTLRAWMRNDDVATTKDPKSGALLVWWPHVRDMHLNTPIRNRPKAG